MLKGPLRGLEGPQGAYMALNDWAMWINKKQGTISVKNITPRSGSRNSCKGNISVSKLILTAGDQRKLSFFRRKGVARILFCWRKGITRIPFLEKRNIHNPFLEKRTIQGPVLEKKMEGEGFLGYR